MYIRAVSRKNKDGSVVRYVQLAHNEWDSEAGYSKVRVVRTFGRQDELDTGASVGWLAASAGSSARKRPCAWNLPAVWL
jgi:hypothetical protein